jgi:hypothetical protein
MDFHLQARIRIRGREYADPEQVPPEIRQKCQSALSALFATPRLNSRIVFNGREFTNPMQLPDEGRRLYEDALGLIWSHRNVTRRSRHSASGKKITLLLVLAGLAALVEYLWAHGYFG